MGAGDTPCAAIQSHPPEDEDRHRRERGDHAEELRAVRHQVPVGLQHHGRRHRNRDDHQVDEHGEHRLADHRRVERAQDHPAADDRELVVAEPPDTQRPGEQQSDHQQRGLGAGQERREQRDAAERRAGPIQNEHGARVIDAKRQEPVMDVIAIRLEDSAGVRLLQPPDGAPRHRDERLGNRHSEHEHRQNRGESGR